MTSRVTQKKNLLKGNPIIKFPLEKKGTERTTLLHRILAENEAHDIA